METYQKHALYALNMLLQRLQITKRLSQIDQISPEIVRAFAQFYFDIKVDNVIKFLEDQLQTPLRHLQPALFNKGDLFTCLSLCEIVYNLIRQNRIQDIPPYPLFTEEIVQLLINRHDVMVAQAVWLNEHHEVNPDGILQARQLQDEYRYNKQKDQQKAIDIDIDYLFEKHLLPIITQYYKPYQTQNEVKYTIDRLYRKLKQIINNAAQQRVYDVQRFQNELNTLINQEMKFAVKVERINLQDEARWRRNERKTVRKEACYITDGINSRKKNEQDLQNEAYQQQLQRIRDLREEELNYIKQKRRNDEINAFQNIAQDVQNMVNRKPANADLYAGELRQQINKRLRQYAGPEHDIIEGDGQRVYKQRVLNGRNMLYTDQ